MIFLFLPMTNNNNNGEKNRMEKERKTKYIRVREYLGMEGRRIGFPSTQAAV